MLFKPGVIELNDRSTEIIDELQKDMKESFDHSCRIFQTEIEKHGDQIWNELQSAIRKVLEFTDQMQKQRKKSDIHYLAFSFLRSSLFQDNPELRIETLDDSFYLDVQEAAAYYCPLFLRERYQEDLSGLYQAVQKKFVRLQAFEMFLVKAQYISYYESFLYRMIESLAELIMEEVIRSGVHITGGFRIIYGEFMDKATAVYAKEKEDEVLSD